LTQTRWVRVSLLVDLAEPGATVAPEKKRSNRAGRAKKNAPKGKRRATATQRGKKTKQPVPAPRRESKGAQILAMIGKTKGATLTEIMEATSWQAHSGAFFPRRPRSTA